MQSFAEALAVLNPNKAGCVVAGILAGHAEAAQVKAALDERDIPATVVAKALTESGSAVTDRAVQRHRRGDCGCKRP